MRHGLVLSGSRLALCRGTLRFPLSVYVIIAGTWIASHVT